VIEQDKAVSIIIVLNFIPLKEVGQQWNSGTKYWKNLCKGNIGWD
jgi:hypothetical protein